ncbi:hypothetical protein ACQKP8_03510 [Photobacterium alginatilyticum]|uniref:hypothetical protein n=1 Tax=Photobacterium alginatilyticum TaxID=1775171 RepID=UPI00406931E7
MQQEKFLVTGGFFDGTSEGYVGKVILSRKNGETTLDFITELITEPPTPSLRLKNKGFAGGSIRGDLLWICSPNQVLAYSISNFKLMHVIDDRLFNDLHYVLADINGLYIVNTGLESLDLFSYDGKLVERKLLTSEERTHLRTNSSEDFRLIDSKPHFMHANYCARNPDGKMILTFVRQRRIVNAEDWNWASPEYTASPHEGLIAKYPPLNQDCLWVTLVPGEIVVSDLTGEKILNRWDLTALNISPGWTRGLCVLEHGLLVGVTRIRASNAGYYSGWTQKEIDISCTSISYIPFDTKKDSVTVEVLNERNAKIFSILSLESQ